MSSIIPVVTIANHGYIPYMENLRESIRRAGITEWQLTVLCMDAQTADYCKNQSIPYFQCSTTTSSEFTNWSEHTEKQVKNLLIQKLDCLFEYMNSNLHVRKFIFMDGDIVVFKNFLPYITRYSEPYDIVFQCDEWNTVPQCNSHVQGSVCVNACTGFMCIKNTPNIRELFNYKKYLWGEQLDNFHDQEYINAILKHPNSPFKNTVRWTTFPRNTIPNGSFRDSLTADAYLLHYNFLIGSKKKESMVEHGHWFT